MAWIWWLLAYLSFGVLSCLISPAPADFKGSRVGLWICTILTWPLAWAFMFAMLFGAFRDRR